MYAHIWAGTGTPAIAWVRKAKDNFWGRPFPPLSYFISMWAGNMSECMLASDWSLWKMQCILGEAASLLLFLTHCVLQPSWPVSLRLVMLSLCPFSLQQCHTPLHTTLSMGAGDWTHVGLEHRGLLPAELLRCPFSIRSKVHKERIVLCV